MEKKKKELEKWLELENQGEEVNGYTPKGEGKTPKTIKIEEPTGNNYYDDISNCY